MKPAEETARDPNAPVLKRGRPAAQRAADSAQAAQTGITAPTVNTADRTRASAETRGPVTPAAEPPSILTGSGVTRTADDAVIMKAREVAFQFADKLPNFFCQQLTTRYESDHPKTGWDALDIVSADVAYEDGQESYKNIKVNNKPANKSMMEIGGSVSTGEFASVLLDLFSSDTAATFRRTGNDSIHGRSTYVYSFDVMREHSHWRVEAPSQLYYPAYSGSVWIDKQTSRALRIEMQSRSVPRLFPFDTTETAVDYDFVRLSTPEEFLLPVDSENLSCQRGTSMCSRNRIEFRNYRKFGTESSITFDSKPK